VTDYAVRLSDLAVLPEFHPLRMVLKPFLTDETINISNKFDGVAVMLTPVDGRDLDAVVEVTQLARQPGQVFPIRMYRRDSGGQWKIIRMETTHD